MVYNEKESFSKRWNNLSWQRPSKEIYVDTRSLGLARTQFNLAINFFLNYISQFRGLYAL